MSRALEDPLPLSASKSFLQAAAPSIRPWICRPATVAAAGAYLESLDSWRRKANLTGALRPRSLAEHTLESILGGGLIPERASVVDVGSGGRFPGDSHRPSPGRIFLWRWSSPGISARRFCGTRRESFPCRTSWFTRPESKTLGKPSSGYHQGCRSRPGWLGDGSLVSSGGALVAWTTEADRLADALPRFRLETVLHVPGLGPTANRTLSPGLGMFHVEPG
jgi:hypothetical protein